MELKQGIPNFGFPGVSESKESACNVGDSSSIPGSKRFLGGGNGNPLQYFCLENPMNREEPGRLSSTGLQTSDTNEQLTFSYRIYALFQHFYLKYFS